MTAVSRTWGVIAIQRKPKQTRRALNAAQFVALGVIAYALMVAALIALVN